MTERHGFFASWIELMLTIAAVAVLVAAVLVGVGEYSILRGQAKARDSTYQGRAQVCRMVVTLGLPPDAICLDPRVAQYYDPSAAATAGSERTAAATLSATCAVASRLAVIVPECAKAP